MKFLLIIGIVMLVLWLARSGRRADDRPVPPAPRDEPDALLSCAHCGLHLPRGDALPGRGGVFCDESHRSAYERAHPPA